MIKSHHTEDETATRTEQEDRIFLARLPSPHTPLRHFLPQRPSLPSLANHITIPRPSQHHGFNRVDNDGSGGAAFAHQVPLARRTVEFLAVDYDNWEFDHSGCFQLFYSGAAAVASRDTMVGPLLLPNHLFQARTALVLEL